MALTSLGRASAICQPAAADPELSIKMTGWPILSANSTNASAVRLSWLGLTGAGSSVLAKESKTGSPILPLLGASLGHCEYLLP